MKFLIVLTLLLLSSLLMPPLYAQDSYTEFERGLNLTESQRRRAEGVRDKYIEEWRFQRQEALRRRLELNDLRKNPSANMERIDRSQRELRDIERAWERSYGRYRSDLSQVLDERQRMQYNQFTEMERRNRSMPQGYRRPGIQRQGPIVPEVYRGPGMQRKGPIAPERYRRPGIQRQGPIVPGKRGYPIKEHRSRGREMRGYDR
jgi:Spy/CpxP family protein refolding chaperone